MKSYLGRRGALHRTDAQAVRLEKRRVTPPTDVGWTVALARFVVCARSGLGFPLAFGSGFGVSPVPPAAD